MTIIAKPWSYRRRPRCLRATTKRDGVRLGLLFLALALGACNESKPAASKDARPTDAAVASAKVPMPRVPKQRPKRPGCRVVKSTGTARFVGGGPIKVGLHLRGTRFIELEKETRIVVRHTVSTRETELNGPALAMPCVDGEEHVLLSRGQLRSVPGPGARPGVQVVIAHPWGTASYGNAQIKVTVTAKSAKIEAIAGEAWLTKTPEGTMRGPSHLNKAKRRSTTSGPASMSALLEACETSASAARDQAKAVLKSPGPDAEPLGERAAAHLKARQAARAACFSAAAAAGLVAEPAEYRRLAAALKKANSRWKSVPKVGQ